MVRKDLIDALTGASAIGGDGLAHAALLVASIEYPDLDPAPYVSRLDAMGEGARRHIQAHVDESGDYSPSARLAGLSIPGGHREVEPDRQSGGRGRPLG